MKYCLFLLLCITVGAAAQNPIDITTSAVPFLRISPDARAGGMGDLGVATSADVNSVFYNRAKLPFAAEKSAVGLTYSPWLRDVTNGMYLLSGSFYQKFGEDQVVSAGLRYFNMGDVPMSDYSGAKLPTAQPREVAADLGYSRKLSDKLGIAVAFRYINSKLATGNFEGVNYKAAITVAADVSLYYTEVDSMHGGWTTGLAVSNLGGKVGYTSDATQKEFIPANLGLGVSYTNVFDEDNRLTFGVEANHLLVPAVPTDAAALADYHNKSVTAGWVSSWNNSQYQVGAGAEYVYKQLLSIRCGYVEVPAASGGNGGFTAGLGLNLTVCELNFSYLAPGGKGSTRSALSNTVRFGLNFAFGR